MIKEMDYNNVALVPLIEKAGGDKVDVGGAIIIKKIINQLGN